MIYLMIILLVVCLTLLKSWSVDTNLKSVWQIKLAQDNENGLQLKRFNNWTKLRQLLMIKIAIITMLMLIILQYQYQIWLSAVIVIGLHIVSYFLAKLKFISNFTNRLYYKYEVKIHHFLDFISISSNNLKLPQFAKPQIESLAHLQFLIKQNQILDKNETNLILASHDFLTLKLEEVMTNMDEVTTIKSSDKLTPLKINDLYQTGQKYFAVKSRQISYLVEINDLTEIKNGLTPDLNALPQHQLELGANLKLNQAVKQMLSENAWVAFVVKKNQKIGIIELTTLIKSLKI